MAARHRPTSCAPAAPGAALLAAIAAVDAALGESAVLVPLLAVGPLVAALRARPACVAGLAALAVVVAVALGPVDTGFLTTAHVIEVLAVVAGSAFAVVAALGRERYEAALDRERMLRSRSDLLARVVDLMAAPLDPDVRLERLVELAVPDIADLCVIDLVEPDGRLHRVTTAATDQSLARELRESRERSPLDPHGPHPVAIAARTREPQLLRAVTDELLVDFAPSEEHLRFTRRAGYRSAMVVPLVTRGHMVGVISFLRLGPDANAYRDTDFETAIAVARRAAIGLDSARLFAELSRARREQAAVLGALAEAVTVQGPDGSLVYANQAAAELLERASPEEVLRTPIGEIVTRFVALDEHGRPFDYAMLPGRRALAGEDDPPAVIMRSISRATGRERWMLVKSKPIRDERGDVAMAVNIMEDVSETRRTEEHQRFLSATSKLISESLEVEEVLERVAAAAVPQLGDFCLVDMPDERGTMRAVAIAHVDPERRRLLAEMRASYPPRDDERGPVGVARHGRSQLVAEVNADILEAYAVDDRHVELMRSLDTRAVALVPLTAGDRVLGTITVATAESRRRLGTDDVELLEEVGRRAGIAVENARVHQARTNIAATLQRSLLPPRLPIVPGLSIAARFRAAGETFEVGGDFYDLFPVEGGWMVVIGDVTGKGPAAAATTSLARFTMRTAAAYERSPAGVLARLNLALASDPDRRQLCTVVCARIATPADGGVEMVAASGGHPLPYLLRAGGVEAVGRPGPLLGAFESAQWSETTVRLELGDSLVLYTDGVTDTRGDDDRFGVDRLAELLAGAEGLEPDDVASRVDDALLAFERGPQRDDVALLVLRAAGGVAAERPLAAAAATR